MNERTKLTSSISNFLYSRRSGRFLRCVKEKEKAAQKKKEILTTPSVTAKSGILFLCPCLPLFVLLCYEYSYLVDCNFSLMEKGLIFNCLDSIWLKPMFYFWWIWCVLMQNLIYQDDPSLPFFESFKAWWWVIKKTRGMSGKTCGRAWGRRESKERICWCICYRFAEMPFWIWFSDI
jgi:hypothetical protein